MKLAPPSFVGALSHEYLAGGLFRSPRALAEWVRGGGGYEKG